MENVNPQEQIDTEFERAQQARARGNEGRARVCAAPWPGLRHANILCARGETIRTPSAFDLLNLLMENSSLSDDLRQLAAHLTLRVNEEFKLPADIDLIAEAKKLYERLSML